MQCQRLAQKARHAQQTGDLFVDQRGICLAAFELLGRTACQRARQRGVAVIRRDRQRPQTGSRRNQRGQSQGAVDPGGEETGMFDPEQGAQAVLQQPESLTGRPVRLAEVSVQRGLGRLGGIQAGEAVESTAGRLRHGIDQSEALRQLAYLNLAVGQQLSGFARAHLQGGERSPHIDAVHRVGTRRQLIGQLDDAHQRMGGAPARQRFGVIAHRIGQPAVGVERLQPVGRMGRRHDVRVEIVRQIVSEAGRPGGLGIHRARPHAQGLRQMRHPDRLPPAAHIAHLCRARRNGRGQ